MPTIKRTTHQPTQPHIRPEPVGGAGILPATGFMRLKQLIGDPNANPPIPPVIPIGSTSIYRKIKEGKFPAPVKLGPMTSAWRVEDIRAWIDAQSNGGAN